MQKLFACLRLSLLGALFILTSCGNFSIPLTIKNEYIEPMSEVIIGTEYVKNIGIGQSRKVKSPVNMVLVTAYTASNEVVHGIFYLYLHNANNVLTITRRGRMVLK